MSYRESGDWYISTMGVPHHLARIGPYHVFDSLGSGGMAAVYRGTRYDGKGWVAVKLIHQSMVRQYLDRFRRGDEDKDQDNPLHMFLDEIIIHQDLDHPNVVRYLDEGHNRCRLPTGAMFDQPYLVMEYVHGQSLAMLYDRTFRSARGFGELPPRWMRVVARIVEQSARGLHHLHELKDSEGQTKRAVHRDVAPKNILVAYDGEVKVSDFGLVTAEQRITGTMLGIIKGTPAYFSPEQTYAQVDLDRRSDVYSLGIVLWEMTLLRRLFRKPKEIDTILTVREGEVPDPSQFCSWYPPALEEIVLRALAKDRNERFASALELADALDDFLDVGEGEIGKRHVSLLMHALFKVPELPKAPTKPSSFAIDPAYNLPTIEDMAPCRPELDPSCFETQPDEGVTQRMAKVSIEDGEKQAPTRPLKPKKKPAKKSSKKIDEVMDLIAESSWTDGELTKPGTPGLRFPVSEKVLAPESDRAETLRMSPTEIEDIEENLETLEMPPYNEMVSVGPAAELLAKQRRQLTELEAAATVRAESASDVPALEREPAASSPDPAEETTEGLSSPNWGVFNRIRRFFGRR